MKTNIIKKSLLFIVLICYIIFEMICMSNGYNGDDYYWSNKDYCKNTLLELVYGSSNWFEKYNSEDYIGKTYGMKYVQLTDGTYKYFYAQDEFGGNYQGAYCIDPENGAGVGEHSNDYGLDIVNVIDINVEKDNTIVVYTMNRDHSVSKKEIANFYNVTDKTTKEGIEYLHALAYMEDMASNYYRSGYYDNKYKTEIAGTFLSSNSIGELQKVVDISGLFQTTGYYAGNASVIEEAKSETKKWLNNTSVTYAESEKENKDMITLNYINDCTYIGPYMLNKSIKINNVKINDKDYDVKIVGVLGSNANNNTAPEEKEFYIKVDKIIDKVDSISIKVPGGGDKLKSRMLLLGNGQCQNYIVWRNETTNGDGEIKLTPPKFGTIEIIKKDTKFGDNINLQDIQFKLYEVGKGWVSATESGNKYSYSRNVSFDHSKSFRVKKEDGEYKCSIGKIPLNSKFEIYEIGIPDNNVTSDLKLTDIYDPLPEIRDPNDPDNPNSNIRARHVDETITIQNATTKKVTVYNSPKGALYIKKFDQETGNPVGGISFKILYSDGKNRHWIRFDNNYNYTDFVDNFTEASSITTRNDGKGTTPIIKRLPEGYYYIFEVDLGNHDDIYELDPYIDELYTNPNPNDVDISMAQEMYSLDGLTKGKEFKLLKDIEKPEELLVGKGTNNSVAYLDISGTVWEDGDSGTKNEIDDGDYRFKDATVRIEEKSTIGLNFPEKILVFPGELSDEISSNIYNLDGTVETENNLPNNSHIEPILGEYQGNNNFKFTIKSDTTIGLRGDVNGDGETNIRDTDLLNKYILDKRLTIDEYNSDVNGDGEINIRDVSALADILKPTEKPKLKVTGTVAEGSKYIVNRKNATTLEVIVTMKKQDETMPREATTNEKGEYKFEKVRKSNLDRYIISLSYDGMTYQTLPTMNSLTDNGSRSIENYNQRLELNNAFKEVTGNGQKITYNDKDITLLYSKQDNNPNGDIILENAGKFDRNSTEKYFTVRKNETQEYTGDFIIDSKIQDGWLRDRYTKLIEKNKSITEITGMNFGLKLRSKVDLSLKKDVAWALVDIKGNEVRYNFEMNKDENNKSKRNMDEIYQIPIYKADYEAFKKDMHIYVTYKLELSYEGDINETSLGRQGVIINKIRDAISSRYTNKIEIIDKDGNKINENCKYNEGENEITDLNLWIDKGKTETIYIKCEMDLDSIVLGNKVNETDIINEAEISSYTVKKAGINYATFDNDSIPNNLNNYDNEDDNDNIVIALKDMGERTSSGLVFVDEPVDGKKGGEGQEKIGDGTYESGEKLVSNVKTTLTNTNNYLADKESRTGSNGQYQFSGLVPGRYYITFTWGEGEGSKAGVEDITVDKYKSTIWNKNNQHNAGNFYEILSSDSDYENYDEYSNRYSDAFDNYELRKQIDLNKYNDYNSEKDKGLLNILQQDNQSSNKNIVMFSKTEYFNIPFKRGQTTGIYASRRKKYKNVSVRKIDFGLIERPMLSMNIDKRVSNVEMVTDQNELLASYELINPETNETKTKGYVTGGPDYGWIKIETDTDILNSGTQAKVKYNIIVKNTSEIDYDDKNYYYYGEKPADSDKKIIKLKPEGVYDYIRGISSDIEKNRNKWDAPIDSEYSSVSKYIAEHIMSNSGESSSTTHYVDFNDILYTKMVYEKWGDTSKEKIEGFTKEYGKETSQFENVLDTFIKSKYNPNLIQEMKPGDTTKLEFDAATYLSSENKLTFDNVAEVRDVIRTSLTGRSVVLEKSNFFNTSEKVIITQTTGENRDYTPIIIVIISAVSMLGIGIVLIKKFVL